MAIVMGCGKFEQDVIKALNLPPRIVGVDIRMRPNEAVKVTIETLMDELQGDQFVTVIKEYELHERTDGDGQ